MNKKIFIGVAFLVVAFVLYVFAPRTVIAPQGDLTTPPLSVFDGKNTQFTVDGITIRLVDGIAQLEAAPNSASKITIRYFGNEAYGDLNGDGKDDVGFLVTRNDGGSGTFFYAVAALSTETGFKTTNAFFIGDRIAPQNNRITARELHINYAERREGESFATRPSMGAVTLLKVTPEGVLEGLMK